MNTWSSLDRMNEADDFAQLSEAFAEGRYEAKGERSARHLIFEDGTLWFPDGLDDWGGIAPALPVLLVSLVASLVAFAIAVHDGLDWWTTAAAVSGGHLLLLVWVAAQNSRREAERRRALGLGVVFRPDEMALCPLPRRRIPRSRVTEFKSRFHGSDNANGLTYLHPVLSDGEEVRTEILETEESSNALRAWLARQT